MSGGVPCPACRKATERHCPETPTCTWLKCKPCGHTLDPVNRRAMDAQGPIPYPRAS